MASPSSIVNLEDATAIDMGEVELDLNIAESQLQFKDFSGMPDVRTTFSQKIPSFNKIGEELSEPDENNIAIEGSELSEKVKINWGLSFFAQYFSINTKVVLDRITGSFMPVKSPAGETYIENCIQNNPDIYGPFWISVTLVFSIAIFGNLSSYLNTNERDVAWHNDWDIVGVAATLVFSYVSLMPLFLWVFFWFRGCTKTYSLMEMTCAYGYSLSIFIPITLLWTIQIATIRYLLVIAASLLSGSVLTMSFAPVVKSDPSPTFKSSFIMLVLIIFLHSMVALAFLIQFERF